MLVVCTLQLSTAAATKAYMDWTAAELTPLMLTYEDFLRGRYYNATRVDLTENGSQVQRETSKNAMSMFEVDSDDWIWEVRNSEVQSAS
jgi:hypothetical protein